MLRTRTCGASLAAVVLLAALTLPVRADETSGTPKAPAASASSKRPVHHRVAKKKAPPPLVLPPLPAGPLPQVPLQQIPESAPTVTFEHGQLTIVAQNATLGEILKQVRKLTGASIDLPGNGAQERVVTAIGPGAPRDVLATLLNGTQFNYVMLGSSTDPTAVASVLLTPKPGAPGETQTAASGFQQGIQGLQGMNPAAVAATMQSFRQQMIAAPQPQPEADAAAEADENADDSEDKDEEATDQAQPAQPAGQPEAQPEQQGNPNQPNAGPRTPEQLLQMMRQGQPGMPGAPPPPQQ